MPHATVTFSWKSVIVFLKTICSYIKKNSQSQNSTPSTQCARRAWESLGRGRGREHSQRKRCWPSVQRAGPAGACGPSPSCPPGLLLRVKHLRLKDCFCWVNESKLSNKPNKLLLNLFPKLSKLLISLPSNFWQN